MASDSDTDASSVISILSPPPLLPEPLHHSACSVIPSAIGHSEDLSGPACVEMGVERGIFILPLRIPGRNGGIYPSNNVDYERVSQPAFVTG